MDEIYYADSGPWLYEIWAEDGQRRWKVTEKETNACLWLENASTIQEAKNQIVIQTGRAPDGAWQVRKIGARAVVDDLRLAVIWNSDHWEWNVLRYKRNERLHHGTTESLEEGKTAAIAATGFDAERVQWQRIG